jgi:protein-L-isoaspartate(D-aspartate) O-methyltransferase
MTREAQIQQMLAAIRTHARQSASFTGRADLDPRVLEAMARVPRDAFVPASLRASAWSDSPLPIGEGQTISQPFIVALMTDLVGPRPDARILEIGTGCGYQTAVLAELVARVYTIEIVPRLAQRAAERLREQGYTHLETRQGDGYQGWPEAAPFDGILVTAAAEHLPTPLLDQLAPGARLVIPLGGRLFGQELMVMERDATGTLHRRGILPVAFVPLTGGH